MNIKCPQCDFENEEGSKFCKNCNAPLSKQDYSKDNPYIKKNIDEIDEIEEEKIRKKIEIEKDKKIRTGAKTKITVLVLLIVLATIAGFFIFKPYINQIKEATDLDASVRFTGTQFIIVNNNNFDWLNVKIEVNGSPSKGGFSLKTDSIKAGETYTVGALLFAKEDGTRFNPFIYKPQKFDIYCNTLKGLKSSWGGDWEEEIVQQQDYWNAEDIENFNAVVKINCGTIQTLIQAELADSDYKTVKGYVVNSSLNGLFSESGIKNPGDGAQTKNGIAGEAGCVVVTFDDALKVFSINGNAFGTGSVLTKPLIARY